MKEGKIHQMPLRIPASLHESLKVGADREGVSLNQYCLYLLASQATSSEEWLSQKAEKLLVFLEEASLFQKEMKKTQSFIEPPKETPLQRLKTLYD